MRGLIKRGSPARRDVCALTLLALLLDLFHLGTTSIVLDESVSVAFARLSFWPLLRRLAGAGDPNMSLYYVLLNLWVRMFGESEAAVRSLSAIFAVLAVSAIYLLGVRLFGRTVGFVAGLLLALDAFITQYAQTARSYTLLVLLVTLSSYFLVVELERPSRRGRIGYVLASTLAVYAHYFAAYVLFVHLGTVVAMKRRTALKREWLGMAVAVLLLCSPEAIVAYRTGAGQIAWIKRPSLNAIRPVLEELAGGSRLLLLALLAGGCYATVSAVRERRYWRQGFVAAWLVVPVVLSFAVSFVRPMFVRQYLIICVPALVLFGTAAIARLRRPALVGLFVVPLVWLSAAQLFVFYRRERGENWRAATRYVLASARPGDAVVFYPDYARAPFEYYQRQSEVAGPANLKGQALAGGQRIWLVIRESDAAANSTEFRQLQASLAERYSAAERRGFHRVRVELYEGRPRQASSTPNFGFEHSAHSR